MIIKVKEPVGPEYERMQRGQLLFTYLHLAPLPELTQVLLDKQIAGVAYETITDRRGALPLLTPMSEVAGRMASLVGAYYLQRRFGGRGTLLSGVPGVPPGDVVIIGGGIVGLNSAKVALGHGRPGGGAGGEPGPHALPGRHLPRPGDHPRQQPLQPARRPRPGRRAGRGRADPGRSAPKLVTREMLGEMKKGSVAVDVAVDQGGCFETTHATTHSDPIYEVDGVIHYCVANMPGAVPRTSTLALNNVTLPYALELASKGLRQAVLDDPGLLAGVNTYGGKITCQPVAESRIGSTRR